MACTVKDLIYVYAAMPYRLQELETSYPGCLIERNEVGNLVAVDPKDQNFYVAWIDVLTGEIHSFI